MSVREKVFVKKSRRGNVQVIARENYLRDDLACGALHCLTCPESYGRATGRVSGRCILIPDADVLLRQPDLIMKTHSSMADMVFTQSTLHKVRSKSADIYESVTQLLVSKHDGRQCAIFSNENHRQTYVQRDQTGETEEKYMVRQLVAAVKWLNTHWSSMGMNGMILTDSKERQYSESEVPVVSAKSLVEKNKELLELYAQHEEEPEEMETDEPGEGEGGKRKRRRAFYPDYLPSRKAKAGVKSGRYFQGTYHPSTYDVTEATVTVCMDKSDSAKRTQVLIVGRKNQNRSIDGDVVIIEVLPKSEWRVPSNLAVELEDGDVDSDAEDDEVKIEPGEISKEEPSNISPKALPTGKVVAIGQRNWRPYCGTLSVESYNGGDSALFVPIDRKIPKIRVRSRRVAELIGKRVLLIVDKWDRNSVHPSGHIVREIGPSEDKEAETEVILIENGIPTRKFSDAAMNCLPKPTWKVTDEHVKSRRDLRDWTICSVDPPGCTDIDDALNFRRINKDEVEVGVHIADVTAFMGHDCALDKEASERGCTVYLVDRRIEMLPSLLSGNFCSLRGGEERLAFSALIRMDNHGNVKNVEFDRSVIKSSAALTYEQAQNRIDAARADKMKGKEVTDAVTVGLLGLAEIAKKLREKRMRAGALVLASPEVKFKISEARDEITDVAMYEIRETNRMVEEFMLLANIVVGEKLLRHFPQCAMLRRHPKPSEEMFEPLIKAAKAGGVEIDVSNSKRLNESLAEVARVAKERGDEYLGTLLRIIATRSMTQAVYFSSGEVSDPEYLHYGLAAPVYTHFTSPIRRYADVLVHRLLAACLGFASLPLGLQDSRKMSEYADIINIRHRCAQYASRASTLLHTVLLFKREIRGDNTALEEEGRIIRVLGNGVVVLVPRYGVEGVVHVDDDGVGKMDETSSSLKLSNGKELRVLDSIQVRIRVDRVPERMDKVIYELAE